MYASFLENNTLTRRTFLQTDVVLMRAWIRSFFKENRNCKIYGEIVALIEGQSKE